MAMSQKRRDTYVDNIIRGLDHFIKPTPDQRAQALRYLDGEGEHNDFARHLLVKLARRSSTARELLLALSKDKSYAEGAERADEILYAAGV